MLPRIITIIAITLTFSTASVVQAQNGYELRQGWQNIAELIASVGKKEEADKILATIDAMSDEELERVYTEESLQNMIKALSEIEKAVNAGNKLLELEKAEVESTNSMTLTADGFPTALDYPDSTYCPLSPSRSNGLALQIAVDAIQAARIALEVAKGVWSGLSRACDETVVILGEGGNASLACIPADIALFVAEGLVGAAEGVVEHFIACDNGVDSAEIGGTWKGLVYVNSVLEGHVEQLSTHDSDIKSELAVINQKLDTQANMLTEVLANQQIIMKLLRTPNGRREGWNK